MPGEKLPISIWVSGDPDFLRRSSCPVKETKIYSTDLEISAIGTLSCKVEQERKIILHGRRLQEILREMDSGEIELEIMDNSLVIKQKQSEFVLSLQDPEEFPDVKEITGNQVLILLQQ